MYCAIKETLRLVLIDCVTPGTTVLGTPFLQKGGRGEGESGENNYKIFKVPK